MTREEPKRRPGRPGPRRTMVAVKLHDEAIGFIDRRASEEGLVKGDGQPNRSEMMRLMLSYAARNMPKRWRE